MGDVKPIVPKNRLQERQLALEEKMGGQHPFHGVLAEVFERIGGIEAMIDWAEDNPAMFYQMMAKAAPPPSQNRGGSGDGGGTTVNVVLPQGLNPGPLDSAPVSEQ